MSSVQILSSAGITSKKSALKNEYVRINISHGRALVAYKPSAIMMDEASKGVRDVRPPITTFKPSMWGDGFSSYSFDHRVQQKYAQEIEALKKEARSLLMAATSTKLMILIDKFERLGLSYHFESEIERKLKHIYDSREDNDDEDYDLFATALQFRLLRQHQYHVSCNGFDKFVDKENKLKETLCSDAAGLLSLYEAAHVRIHNEHILDEALAFTTHHLSRMVPQLESPLKEVVQHALVYPLHKSVMILNLRFNISIYEEDDSRGELLLRLAKLNFNFLRNIYRNELFQLSTWSKKYNIKSKVPYTRDRLIETYIWGLAYHFQPQYSYVRTVTAKMYQMLTVMDDTYDNYATLQEMELFTRALERWDMDEVDLLPDYIKHAYEYILSISEEIKRDAVKEEKSYAFPYYIKAIQQLGRAYWEEQKWIMERQMPTFEGYMINSVITGLVYVTFIASMPGLKSTTKETTEWLLSEPEILVSSTMAGRLLDDLASHQRESKEGSMLTVVDCYMKDKGVSKQEAFSAFADEIEDRWKRVNAEWVKSRMVPKEIVEQFINILRIAEMTYKNNIDGVTHPEKNLAPFINALLVDPLPI